MSGQAAPGAGTGAARHRYRRLGSRDGEGAGGAAGNERLTAMTGAALLVLFAAEGVTILALHRLLTLHFFIGMLLAGPVALKISSTGYRFIRYYAGARPYVRKGPPAPLLRLLAPVVVLTSCGVPRWPSRRRGPRLAGPAGPARRRAGRRHAPGCHHDPPDRPVAAPRRRRGITPPGRGRRG
jgi:hypothetical protein